MYKIITIISLKCLRKAMMKDIGRNSRHRMGFEPGMTRMRINALHCFNSVAQLALRYNANVFKP
jgi:hypothetical protein